MAEILKKIFNDIFELLMKSIKNGIPALHIPPLDPLKIPGKEEFELKKSVLVAIDASFSDVEVTGLSTMDPPSLHLKDHTIYATTTTKAVQVKGKYTLKGDAIEIIPISADSTFTCEAESITVLIGLRFTAKDIATLDPKVTVEVYLGELKLHVNDLEHSKIISGIVNWILNRFSGTIAKHMEEQIGKALQDALQRIIDKHKLNTADEILRALKEL